MTPVDLEAARKVAAEARESAAKVEAAQEAFLDDDDQEVAIEQALTVAFDLLPKLSALVEQMAEEIDRMRPIEEEAVKVARRFLAAGNEHQVVDLVAACGLGHWP